MFLKALKAVIFWGIEDETPDADDQKSFPKKEDSLKAAISSDAERLLRDESVLNGSEVPRYPPFKTGLPLVSPETLLQTQEELILKIRDSLGLSPDEYNTLIHPLIVSFAKFVHLLPASETHHHRGAGGLFRHSLEAGAYAAQIADSKVFSYGKTPIDRKKEEPKWVVATFVAAMLHDIGKSATDMAIISADGESEWSPYLESLWDWGLKNDVSRYFVRWKESRHKKHEQAGLLLSNQILTVEIKDWLGSGSSEIISTMLQACTCQGDDIVSDIVKRSDSASVNQDLKTNQGSGNDLSVGVPVERHLLDACRRLIKSGKWTINKKGSRVWVTREGVFIVWRSGGSDEIVELLNEDKVPGIPRDPDTLADLLLERDIAQHDTERNEGHVNRYWEIAPSVLDGIWLNCLKISQVETLFSSEPPVPLKTLVRMANGQERTLDGFDPSLEKDAAPKANNNKKPNQKPKSNTPDSVPTLVKKQKEEQGELPLPKPEESASPAPKTETLSDTQSPSHSDASAPAQPKVTPTPAPAEPKVNPGQIAKAWFENHGSEASDLIVKIFKDIELKIREKHGIFGVEGSVSYLKYPSPIRPYGKPSDIVKMLNDENWIIPDPSNPNMKARDMGDGKGLVFNVEISEKIISMLTYGVGEIDIPKDTSKPSFSDLMSDASKKISEKAQATPTQAVKQPATKPEATPKPEPTPAPSPSHQTPQATPERPEVVRPDARVQKQAISETRQVIHNHEDPSVPPKVVRKVNKDVSDTVDNFMLAARTGQIEGSTQRHKNSGAICNVVGMSRLIKFGKEFSGSDLRLACEQRNDCHLEGNSIWVIIDAE